MTEKFELVSKYKPTGDQPQAIEKMLKALDEGQKSQILLGVTGSGKTFTMANVIAAVNRTTLILAPNKTLAAQLFAEFRELFPNNAVEYFVSYYDYYQPEAYLPKNDTYIEKDADINERIDKLRHSATVSLLERKDVVIVASVSCIYGLGSPEAYHDMILYLEKGLEVERNKALRKLTEIQYKRKDFAFERGSFRVRGDVLDIFPVYEDSKIIRAEFFDDEIESISEVDPLTGEILREMTKATIYPASHYVVQEEKLERACTAIDAELDERIEYYKELQKPLELQRIKQRTEYDLELIRNIGYCSGIENYSRHLEERAPGSTAATLMH
ncbi:MAG: DEAD/DEAH box helicase family protein [Planctomycetes bacterium]|nr:DEAD/DEAH box helicase family protein [Planctomycetota bacterium]